MPETLVNINGSRFAFDGARWRSADDKLPEFIAQTVLNHLQPLTSRFAGHHILRADTAEACLKATGFSYEIVERGRDVWNEGIPEGAAG